MYAYWVNCVTYFLLAADSRQAYKSMGREGRTAEYTSNAGDCIIGTSDAYVFISALACLADQIIAAATVVRVGSAHGNGSDRLTKLDWQTAVITYTNRRTACSCCWCYWAEKTWRQLRKLEPIECVYIHSFHCIFFRFRHLLRASPTPSLCHNGSAVHPLHCFYVSCIIFHLHAIHRN